MLPKVREYGVELDAAAKSSWAMSLWITVARERAWLRMPATRFERKAEEPQKPEPPPAKTVPFSESNIAPALAKLRQMLKNDDVNEEELMAILRESAPRHTVLFSQLDEVPSRTVELCIQRWETIRELIAAMRGDGGEAA
jgi:hypothetical protein